MLGCHPFRCSPRAASRNATRTASRSTCRRRKWIDNNRRVEQLPGIPGLPMFITDRLVVDGGWIEKRGTTASTCIGRRASCRATPARPTPGSTTCTESIPDDADHIIRWLAHHRQHPGDKINHALVLGGDQGIGKDTLLEPVKHAVGPWNFHEISPTHLLGAFNGFVKVGHPADQRRARSRRSRPLQVL